MKIAVIILLAATTAAGARPTDWMEQSQRLVVGRTIVSSPLCNAKEVVVSLKVTIGREGEVKDVERNKNSHHPKPLSKIMELVKNEVMKWRFKPLKVGNSFVEVETRPTVVCH